MSRHRLIPLRRRVFLGCEGGSERGYGALLSKLLEERRQDVHLDVVHFRPGGGDPLALVEKSINHITRSEKNGYAPYTIRGLLLDKDLLGKDAARDAKAVEQAAKFRLKLIWQDPCHEALLLRHLDDCLQLRPQTSILALNRLKQEWPAYEKGMSALGLGQRIRHEDVVRAASVEPFLQEFLVRIGFLE